MASFSYLVFVMAVVHSYGQKTGVYDFITPCPIKDNVCLLNLWQDAIKHLAVGRSDLNIPPLDPLPVNDIEINVPGLVYFKFDGLVHGFKTCVFDNAKTYVRKGHFKEALDLHCDIYIKGTYNASINSTALLGFGEDTFLRANGDGKVKLDAVSLKFLMDFKIIKDSNGVTKFQLKNGPVGYKFKIGGPVVFTGNKIFLANEDISDFVASYANQNWKVVMAVFGGFFFDKAIEVVSEFVRAVVDNPPASVFFTDNLDQLVLKNNITPHK